MVAILGFQFGLYHVVAPLSFLRSISLALLLAILLMPEEDKSLPSSCTAFFAGLRGQLISVTYLRRTARNT